MVKHFCVSFVDPRCQSLEISYGK